jgi:exopolysaccharide biosynthesis predicted pyruvyltransferase EpsI
MKNNNQENINTLKNIIYKNLDPLITKDFCLLDVPLYNNIGDTLIWEGTIQYLNRLPSKLLKEIGIYEYSKNMIPDNCIILLQGGGNFGDLWPVFNIFRKEIISTFKNHKIIILPQTVYYKDMKNAKHDAELFSKHKDLTLCARDIRSYNFLKKYFKDNQIILLPDMAFCGDYSQYIHSNQKNKILFLKRHDQELLHKNTLVDGFIKDFDRNKKIETSDWPSIEQEYSKIPNNNIFNRVRGFLGKILGERRKLIILRFLKSLAIQKKINHNEFRLKNVAEGIEFINSYDSIYTTRLHGFILAMLLNKRTFIFDNSYGKNSGYFKTWLKDFEKIELLDEFKEKSA